MDPQRLTKTCAGVEEELREHDVSELCKSVTSTGLDSEEVSGTTDLVLRAVLGDAGHNFRLFLEFCEPFARFTQAIGRLRRSSWHAQELQWPGFDATVRQRYHSRLQYVR